MESYISNFSASISLVSFIALAIYLYKEGKKHNQMKNSKSSHFILFWLIMWFVTSTISNIADEAVYRGLTVLILFVLVYYLEFVHEPTKVLIIDTSGSNLSLLGFPLDTNKLIEYLTPYFGDKKFVLIESDGNYVKRYDMCLSDLKNHKFPNTGRDYVQDCIDWMGMNYLAINKTYILTDGYFFGPLDFKNTKNEVVILKTVKDDFVPKANKEMTIISKNIQ